jgi:outer membrane protein assembly factor BamB
LDLVRQFDTVTPPWYAGQCVLVEDGAVILAPGGKDALLMAVDCETGQVRWRTPNPAAWRMTHSSIMPMYFSGAHQYLYCASLGVVGVSATDGKELWRTRDWKISFANVPSPVVLEEGKIFLTGGYNAGSLMLQLQEAGGQIKVAKLFKLEPEVFAATQHTPIYYNQHLFGVRADGQFVCLDLNGKVRWTSTPKHQFGLGPFLLADGLCFVLSETGKLSLIEANPDQFNLLAQAQVFKGHEAWGPMALAGGKLLLRDLTHLFCLDVEKK